ncbi:hypothetical protein BX666DRAFT_1930454 [Dichotomocladium elegans]|nr:hypothetical protein BX666DRAFT_1930454 [Dichotomocladium elegans]
MKSSYAVPVLALIAASLSGTTNAADIPHSSQVNANSRVGTAFYDENGRILVPRDAGWDQAEVTYDSEGRIIGIKQAVAAAAEDSRGITYNSEGGIVLPDQHFAATGGGGSGGGSKGCGSSHCVPMPYRMGYMDDGETNSGKLNVITYDSNGGIVLPNNVAQQSATSQKAKKPDEEDDMIPMPFTRGSKVAVDQGQTQANAYSATTPQENQYRQGNAYFYDLEGHRGSCGKHAKNTDLVAALSAAVMGADQGASNENCGKHLEVKGASGQTVDVEVVDYCNTCSEGKYPSFSFLILPDYPAYTLLPGSFAHHTTIHFR